MPPKKVGPRDAIPEGTGNLKHNRSQSNSPTAQQGEGNKQKFAWLYQMMADPYLRDSTKVVAAVAALKLAGSTPET